MGEKVTSLKRPRQTSSRGFAIVFRSSGDFWSQKLFNTQIEAQDFWDGYWRTFPGNNKPQWRQYKIVRARQSLAYTGEL